MEVQTGAELAVVPTPRCPLCGKSGEDLYRDLRDRLFDAPGSWNLLTCKSCQLAWLDPQPVPSEIWKLYRSYYTSREAAATPASVIHRVSEFAKGGLLDALGYRSPARSPFERAVGRALMILPGIRAAITYHVRYLEGPATGRLLDAGCGDASFLHEMKLLGWDTVGIEPDANAVEKATRRYRMRILNTTLENMSFPPNSFDAITLGHVIEHSFDPVRALFNCRNSLKPGGKVVITTPNLNSLGHSRFRSAWFHLDPPRHLHLFSQRSLGECAARAGLTTSVQMTVALNASFAWKMSRQVSRGATHGAIDLRPSFGIRGGVFQAAEQFRILSHGAGGEEIVLVATRGP